MGFIYALLVAMAIAVAVASARNIPHKVLRSTAVDCGDLDDPEYGDVDFSKTTDGSKATYSCQQGYYLAGPKTRFCLYLGKWGGNTPVCKRKYMCMRV